MVTRCFMKSNYKRSPTCCGVDISDTASHHRGPRVRIPACASMHVIVMVAEKLRLRMQERRYVDLVTLLKSQECDMCLVVFPVGLVPKLGSRANTKELQLIPLFVTTFAPLFSSGQKTSRPKDIHIY